MDSPDKGHTLQAVEHPDQVVVHQMEECSHCHTSLDGMEGPLLEGELERAAEWVMQIIST